MAYSNYAMIFKLVYVIYKGIYYECFLRAVVDIRLRPVARICAQVDAPCGVPIGSVCPPWSPGLPRQLQK